jgi:hypothetical protein
VNFFGGFYEAAYNSQFPRRLKGITSGEREAVCDAQTAKGKPRKQITSGFSELSANYAVFSAMYIKILSLNIKITTK